MAWREDASFGKIRVGLGRAIPQNFGVVDITAAKTLTRADSGTHFLLKAAAGVGVTLPALERGLRFRFSVGLAFATSNWVVAEADAAAVIEGIIVVNGASVPASNEKQVNFVNSAESLGDYVEMWCDGTSWFVSGIGNGAGSITVTAP